MYVYTPHHCSKVAIFHPSTGIALSKHWEYWNTNGDCMPMAMMMELMEPKSSFKSVQNPANPDFSRGTV
jgi:hypothetical protein